MLAIKFAVLAAMLISTQSGRADPAKLGLKLETLVINLDRPWGMTILPDQSLLITERTGQLRHWQQGKISAPIRGLPEVYDAGQGGLLDVLAAADFASSAKIWISYAAGSADANYTAVSELILDMQSVPPSVRSRRSLFKASPAKSGSAHFGGRLAAVEQHLWLTLGDGFDFREAAQDSASHLGKIVRIKLTAPNSAAIYASGHRNAQGLLWDPAKKLLWSHEHGPKGGDELNIIVQGSNYGWPAVTAGLDYTRAQVSPFKAHARFVSPAHIWTPSIAPSGMVIYAGTLFPEWQGNLLITALAGRALHRLVLNGQTVLSEEKLLTDENTRWRDIEVAADGTLYLLSDGENAKLVLVRREQ